MITGMIIDSMDTFLVGALQLITAIFVLGWLWSVIWGLELVHRSVRRGIGADNVDGRGGAGAGWESNDPPETFVGVSGVANNGRQAV